MHPDLERYLKTEYMKNVFGRFVRLLMSRDRRLAREDAENLVQTGVLKAVQHGDRYDPRLAEPQTWVSRIIERTIQDYWRSAAVKKRFFLPSSGETDADESSAEERIFKTAADQDEYVLKKQLFNWHMRALARISDAQAKVLLLRYGFAMDNPGIASVLKKTEGAVAALISHGIDSMAGHFTSGFVAPPETVDFTLTRRELNLLLRGDAKAVEIVEDFLFNGLSREKIAEKHKVDAVELDRLIDLLLAGVRDGLVKRRKKDAAVKTPDETRENFFSALFLEGFLSLFVEKYTESLKKRN